MPYGERHKINRINSLGINLFTQFKCLAIKLKNKGKIKTVLKLGENYLYD